MRACRRLFADEPRVLADEPRLLAHQPGYAPRILTGASASVNRLACSLERIRRCARKCGGVANTQHLKEVQYCVCACHSVLADQPRLLADKSRHAPPHAPRPCGPLMRLAHIGCPCSSHCKKKKVLCGSTDGPVYECCRSVQPHQSRLQPHQPQLLAHEPRVLADEPRQAARPCRTCVGELPACVLCVPALS